MGDRIRLSQVIYNLLSNAMKYTPEGKSIEVRLRHDDSNAAICVLDEGRGIPDDELEKVFEGFYPSSVSEKPGSHGLAVSHRARPLYQPGDGQGSRRGPVCGKPPGRGDGHVPQAASCGTLVTNPSYMIARRWHFPLAVSRIW